MSFYSGLALTAKSLLTSKGQTVTFSRDNITVNNQITGEQTKGAATTYTGVGAALDFKTGEIDGEHVQFNDKRLILEATTTAPEIGDAATIGGLTHRVIDVKTVSPGGVVVIYILQLRY